MQILREAILLPKIADKVIVIEVLVARRRRSSVCCAMYIDAARGSFDNVELEDGCRSQSSERLYRIYEVSVDLVDLACRYVDEDDGCFAV